MYATLEQRRVFQRPLFFSSRVERWKVHTHTQRTHTHRHTDTQFADRWTSLGREMIHLPRGTKLHLRSFIRTWVFTRDSDSSRHDSFLHLCNRKRKYTPGKFKPVTFLLDSFDLMRWIYKRFLSTFFPLCVELISVLKNSRAAVSSSKFNIQVFVWPSNPTRGVISILSYLTYEQINWEIVETIMKVNRLNS